jgi:hypothetical protein
MAFPTSLTNAVDGVTEVVAAHLNNLEAKVGIDGSAVTTSLDYLLQNSASVDPGHKHNVFKLVDFAAVFGGIYANDPAYASLEAADAAAYAAGKVLIINSSCDIDTTSGDVTLQAKLAPMPGAMLNRTGSANHLIINQLAITPELFSWVNDDSATRDWVQFSAGAAAVFHPEWWGARADNSTDSGPAINAALIAASSCSGSVVLASGSYLTSVNLLVLAQTKLVGQGMFNTILSPIAGSTNVDCLIKGAGDCYVLSDFKIDGLNGAVNGSGTAISGISLSPLNCGYKHYSLKNIWVSSMSGEGIFNETYDDGNQDHQTGYATLINCWTDHCAMVHGFGGFAPGGDDMLFIGCMAWSNGRSGSGDGFNFAGGDRMHMIGCISHDNTMHGVNLVTDLNNNRGMRYCRIDCTCYNNSSDFGNSDTNNAGNEWVQDSQSKSLKSDINLTSTTMVPVTDLACKLQGGQTYGFRFWLPVNGDTTGGMNINMAAGTLPTTCTLRCEITCFNNSTMSFVQVGQITGLDTTVNLHADGVGIVTIEGRITVDINGEGTLVPQFSLHTDGSYTSIVRAGATVKVWPMVQ